MPRKPVKFIVRAMGSEIVLGEFSSLERAFGRATFVALRHMQPYGTWIECVTLPEWQTFFIVDHDGGDIYVVGHSQARERETVTA